jgi:transcriptional regulator with PAS, ATPase and Fis domain
MEKLKAHPWPGNVRELRTALERAAVLAGNQPAIEAAHVVLDAPIMRATPTTPNTTRSGKLDKAAIERALASTSGNQKEAAKLLGVSRPTLLKYIDLYGLGRPRKR